MEKGFGRLMLSVMAVPFVCAFMFVVIYVVLVGLTIPQLPEWAQAGVEEWMLGIPQDSDVYPSEEGFYGIDLGEIPATYTSVEWYGYSDENAGVIYGVPVEGYGGAPPIGCNFGYEPNYTILGEGVRHPGADWEIAEGNQVATVMGGMVVYAGWNDGWGGLVVVENGDYQVWYAHLKEISVTQGQILQHGDDVGLSGGETPPAGNSTGPHLHQGIKQRVGGTYFWIDPVQFLESNEWVDAPCG